MLGVFFNFHFLWRKKPWKFSVESREGIKWCLGRWVLPKSQGSTGKQQNWQKLCPVLLYLRRKMNPNQPIPSGSWGFCTVRIPGSQWILNFPQWGESEQNKSHILLRICFATQMWCSDGTQKFCQNHTDSKCLNRAQSDFPEFFVSEGRKKAVVE